MQTTENQGRPRSPEKHEAILDAAQDLLLEHGFADTSLEMIAEAAGVGKPTVYRHFGGKEQVVEAVVRRRDEGFLKKLELSRTENQSVREDLLSFARKFEETVLHPSTRAWDRLVISEAERRPKLARTLYRAGPQKLHDALQAYLEETIARGELKTKDPQLAAEHFIGLLSGLELLRGQMASMQRRTRRDKDKRLEAAVDGFLAIYS